MAKFLFALFAIIGVVYGAASKSNLPQKKNTMNLQSCTDISPLLTGYACPSSDLCAPFRDPNCDPLSLYPCSCNVRTPSTIIFEISNGGVNNDLVDIDFLCPATQSPLFTCEACKCPAPGVQIQGINGYTCSADAVVDTLVGACPDGSSVTQSWTCSLTCANSLFQCVTNAESGPSFYKGYCCS